jgi:hypothetical protein
MTRRCPNCADEMKPCGNTSFYRQGRTSVIEWVRCLGCAHASIDYIHPVEDSPVLVQVSRVLSDETLDNVQLETRQRAPVSSAY